MYFFLPCKNCFPIYNTKIGTSTLHPAAFTLHVISSPKLYLSLSSPYPHYIVLSTFPCGTIYSSYFSCMVSSIYSHRIVSSISN